MKVATNRANLNYAHTLKKMGYKTAIHALPQDGMDLVDSLLERGHSNFSIANEINRQYDKYFAGIGLQPVSYYSVKTYKENHWKNGEGFSKLVTGQSEAIKAKIEQLNYEANEMLKKFDALSQMVEVALKQKALVIDRDSKLEDNPMGMIDSNRDSARFRYFQMCSKIHDTYVALGIVKPLPPPPIQVEATIKHEEETPTSNEDYIKRLTKLLDVMKRQGKYAKHCSGQRIGMGGVILPPEA